MLPLPLPSGLPCICMFIQPTAKHGAFFKKKKSYYFIYLKGEGWREMDFPFIDAFPQIPTTTRIGSGQSQKLNPDLPSRWQGLNCFGHHLLPSRVLNGRKLKLGVELRLESRHINMGCGHPKKFLNCCAK